MWAGRAGKTYNCMTPTPSHKFSIPHIHVVTSCGSFRILGRAVIPTLAATIAYYFPSGSFLRLAFLEEGLAGRAL